MWDSSGQPWVEWSSWYKALNGGEMGRARGAAISAAELQTLATYQLKYDGILFNPGLVVYEGKLVVIARTTMRGDNLIGEVQGQGLVGARSLRARYPIPNGYEDLRVFVFNGELWASGTWSPGNKTIGSPPAQIALLKIVNGQLDLIAPFRSPRYEKNWMPVVDQIDGRDRLRFVYATDPCVVVLTYGDGGLTPPPEHAPMATNGVLRGGSQLVRYGDGWLAIVHEVSGPNGSSVYVHRFVKFNADLTSARAGRPFYFQRKGIEFAAGLVDLTTLGQSGVFAVSYGVDDKRAFIAEVSRATIDEFLTETTAYPVASMPHAPSRPQAHEIHQVVSTASSGSGKPAGNKIANPLIGGYGWD